MEERFEWDIWQPNTQQPSLKDAVAALQGKITNHYTVGTHTIFIVELDHIQTMPQTSLVYFARQFKAVEI